MNSLDPRKIHRLINAGFALTAVILVAVVFLFGPSGQINKIKAARANKAVAAQINKVIAEQDAEDAGLKHLTLTSQSTKLTTGQVGVAYNTVLKMYGENMGPFDWQTVSGKWPKGMRLDSYEGRVWGRPDDAGTYKLKIRVTDGIGMSSDYDLTLVIKPAS